MGNRRIMNKSVSNIIPLKSGICPICGKASARSYRLFCSKRCADIDLGHWLSEQYRFPVLSSELKDDEYED